MTIKEAHIIINGVELTFSQAMTLRVAIGSFLLTLNDKGLGDDKIGKKICENYIRSASEIQTLIHKEDRDRSKWTEYGL